jgi:hypothetical protein
MSGTNAATQSQATGVDEETGDGRGAEVQNEVAEEPEPVTRDAVIGTGTPDERRSQP